MGHLDVYKDYMKNVQVFKGTPTALATGHVDFHVHELQVFKGAPTALAMGF